MKKVLTILIAAIVIASGMQVSLDRHYCGGNLIDIKISVTGKLATCGMEQSESGCPDNPVIGKKCCEDKVSFYCLNSNYCPEYFKIKQLVSVRDLLPGHFCNLATSDSFNTDLVNWVLPPGARLKSWLTQPEICVFRM